jgi:hypothetical protein
MLATEESFEQAGWMHCGSGWYNPNDEENTRCQGGVGEAKCGNAWVNTALLLGCRRSGSEGNYIYTIVTFEQMYCGG